MCQTLTDIASGYTVATITGDFFGDSELAGLGVEGLVSLEVSTHHHLHYYHDHGHLMVCIIREEDH